MRHLSTSPIIGDGELKDPSDVEALMEKAIGKCPVAEVKVSGQSANGLLDTGAEVSTITEGYFRNHLLPRGQTLKDITGWLQMGCLCPISAM
ncbi:hypothetical protein LSAT2_031175 [Lamellibrachia satsuma]|nr:hypothetical protein LSAT2_031175 [Lamellibrachia satsuma]